MTRVSKRLGSNDTGELLDALVRITDEPELHRKRILEIREAEDAAVEAERRVIKAKQELDEFAAALDEQKRRQDKREKGLVEREGQITVREKSSDEQRQVAENLVIQARALESSVRDLERDLERRSTEAIRAVRALVKKGA